MVLSYGLAAHGEDWPQWRGPSGQNHAATGATAPEKWSAEENLAWNTPIPGRGHSSPVIVGERIYLTTCDEQAETQSLLVLDRKTGELLTQTVAHQGKLPPRIHGNNTHASPTVACDGKNVFALFNNDLACWITKFDLDGKQVWQKRIAPFDPQQFRFGFGSSPILVDGLLVFSTEFDGDGSGVYGIDTNSGEEVWHIARPESLSYSTPIPAKLDGKTQLVMSGNDRIASYDPKTGRELWSTPGSTKATCGTMVWDTERNLAFASGGYPGSFTLAVRGTGDHDIVWEKGQPRCYEQSLLLVDGNLFALADNGIAFCLRGEDGETMWRERLDGPVSASPIYVDGKVYVTNEEATTFVFRASPAGFELVAENKLGDECFATTTPVDGRLYHRYAVRRDGQRQEYLAAIGE
ncbi:Dehydrogenase [Durusdinium trenchii]|uniref:Dehydrogenase n=1 Tax=Durusdinium trenchii TaxID=1381693 RepID=A0ABP0LFV3_9DINO